MRVLRDTEHHSAESSDDIVKDGSQPAFTREAPSDCPYEGSHLLDVENGPAEDGFGARRDRRLACTEHCRRRSAVSRFADGIELRTSAALIAHLAAFIADC
jgi:hypothetical protein